METRDEKDEHENKEKRLSQVSVERAGVIAKIVIQNILRRHGVELTLSQVNEQYEHEVRDIAGAGIAAGGALILEWLVDGQKETLDNPIVALISLVDSESHGLMRDAFGKDLRTVKILAAAMYKQSTESHDEWAAKREVDIDGNPL